jgi:RNA polymerase sigma-70 factor (ECF subfamily)
MMEPSQLGQLVEAHAAGLVLYARQWCAAPEDVVQEAFLKLMALPHPPNQPLAWLYRVVRNGAISAVRSGQRRRKHEAIRAERGQSWFLPSEETDLDARMATQALQSLPNEEREAINMHLWGGLTFLEIADVLGCTHSTAHRWYVAGLQRLRERLDSPCPRMKSNS